jgi:hypothetical protein
VSVIDTGTLVSFLAEMSTVRDNAPFVLKVPRFMARPATTHVAAPATFPVLTTEPLPVCAYVIFAT